MNLFIDTSALVKYFHRESGSDLVEQLIDDSANSIWMSELSVVESLSAFHRRFRLGELNSEQLNIAVEGFRKEVRRFRIQPLNSMVTGEAELLLTEWANTHALRTLDALQLASFSLISEKDWRFVLADEALERTAQACGYQTLLVCK